MLAYPVEMVIAEKLVTALERGSTSTRWRDFVDLLALAQVGVDEEHAARSVHRAAKHRGVDPEGFARLRDDFGSETQGRWEAWTRKAGLDGHVPDAFADVLAALAPWVEQLVLHVEVLDHADDGEGGRR